MEFISDIFKKVIVLKEDKVSIETRGFLDKLTGVPEVEFRYEEINSIEIFDSRKGLLTLTIPSITFKVDGQEFKGADTENPYKVQYTYKKKEEARKVREEIYRRIEERKNQDNKGSSSQADELKKFADLKQQGIITEEEFNTKKKQILGL